jgi:hypothetical protein
LEAGVLSRWTATHLTSPLAVCEAAIAVAWLPTFRPGAGLNKDRMGQGLPYT